jgi:hypothetical protein
MIVIVSRWNRWESDYLGRRQWHGIPTPGGVCRLRDLRNCHSIKVAHGTSSTSSSGLVPCPRRSQRTLHTWPSTRRDNIPCSWRCLQALGLPAPRSERWFQSDLTATTCWRVFIHSDTASLKACWKTRSLRPCRSVVPEATDVKINQSDQIWSDDLLRQGFCQ